MALTSTGLVTSTGYLWDGQQILEERDASHAVVATYIYGVGIDEVLTMRRGGQSYYYHANSIGSIAALTEGAGQVVERYAYDIYGEATILDRTGWPLATSRVGNAYTFTGRWLDHETGLLHYRQRYYNPALGRFLTRDPQGYADSFNFYEYVNSNPVNRIDPLGECGPLCTAAAGAVVGGAIEWGRQGWNNHRAGMTWREAVTNVDVGQIAGAAVKGAIIGGSFGAASGVGFLGSVAVGGASFVVGGQAEPLAAATVNEALDWAKGRSEFSGSRIWKKARQDGLLDLQQMASDARTGMKAGAVVGVFGWIRIGKEFKINNNFRIAPFGNRTGHPTGRFPHYHRRVIDKVTGQTKPGGAVGRHRPWDTKSTDISFWDRF
jgi:RHS repeat-associated protein